jgi:hypothetical protein
MQLDLKNGITNSLNGLYIGGTPGSGQFINGYIGEIIIYQGVLSTTQRQQIEGYLALKWGLQSNLPTNHPYSQSMATTTNNFTSTSTDGINWVNTFQYYN